MPRVLHFVVFTWYLTNRLNDNRSEYADYTELYAYASILVVLFSYRMDTSMFRFGKKKEDFDTVYSTAFFPLVFSALTLVTIGAVFGQSIADALAFGDKPHYIVWFCWIIAFDVLNLLPFAKMRLHGQALRFVKFKVFNIVLTILIVLLCLEWLPKPTVDRFFPFCNSDIDFVFMANLIASASLFIFLMWTNRPKSFAVNPALWKKMALYGLPLVIVGIAGSINQFFAVPLQKYLLGEAIEINRDRAAVYGAVQKIPALLALFTTAYNYAAEPFFFKNAEEKDSKKLYGDILLFFVLAGGVASVGLNSLISIFGFLIGPNFREGLYLVPILLMAYLFLGIYYNVSIWYKLSDRTIYGAYIALFGALITLTGNMLLLPIYGIDASAWIALLCYIVMVITAWRLGISRYPIEYPVSRIAMHLLIISGFLLVGSFFNAQAHNNVFIGFATVCAYIALTLVIEKRRFIALLRGTQI